MKTFRYLVFSLLAALVLLVAGGVVLLLVVDPNDFRGEISSLARDQSGMVLNLEGDLSWQFYPVLGFEVEEVELALSGDQPALIHMANMTLGIKLLPLLSGRLEVDELVLNGLRADLQIDEQGKNNWQLSDTARAREGETGGRDDSTAKERAAKPVTPPATYPDLRLSRVNVTDTRITYNDKTVARSYTLDIPLLELQGVNFEEAFPMLMEARIRDGDDTVDTSLKWRSRVLVNPALGIFALNDLDVGGAVTKPFSQAVDFALRGEVSVDTNRDSARVKLDTIGLGNLVGSGDVALSDLSNALSYKGSLQIPPFDIRQFLKILGMPLSPVSDEQALRQLAFSAEMAGTSQKFELAPLKLTIDDSTVKGDVKIVDFARQETLFTLQLDTIDLDRYLPRQAAPVDSAPGHASAESGQSEELFPTETLKNLALTGALMAGSVTISKIPIEDLSARISAREGDVRIENLQALLLQGSLKGELGLNVVGAQPRVKAAITLHDVEAGEWFSLREEAPLLSGRSSLTLAVQTEGNSSEALIEQAKGASQLRSQQLVLHGVNLNQIALDSVKEELEQFSRLYPDYQQKLPGILRGDTTVNQLATDMILQNGRLLTPLFQADTGEGKITAKGDINLLDSTFDYQVGVELKAVDENKYLKGARWPIRCSGSIEASASDWCRPDKDGFRRVLEKAASEALRKKAADKVAEKLGLEEGNSAEEDLRAKAEQEKARAKEKLEEALKKKLNKLFD